MARTVVPSEVGPKGERALADVWETLILFMGTYGPRVSEALDLLIGDVDLDALTVHIRGTKTKASDRHLPISYGMGERLRGLMGDRPKDKLVFTTGKGTRINRERVGDRVRDASLRALGRTIRPHDLRHTAATHYISAQGLATAGALLGHANPGITATVYGHTTRRDMERAAHAVGQRMDELTRAPKPPPTYTGDERPDDDTKF